MNGESPPRPDVLRASRVDAAVGRKLKSARTQLAATEDFVAAALGLSVEAYRCIEHGTAQLSPGRVIQAAQLFGLQPSSLCGDPGVSAASGIVGAVSSASREAASGLKATVIDLAAARHRREG